MTDTEYEKCDLDYLIRVLENATHSGLTLYEGNKIMLTLLKKLMKEVDQTNQRINGLIEKK